MLSCVCSGMCTCCVSTCCESTSKKPFMRGTCYILLHDIPSPYKYKTSGLNDLTNSLACAI